MRKKFVPIYIILSLLTIVAFCEIKKESINVENFLPIFYLPIVDIQNGNGITSVYYDINEDTSTYSIEITVVFADEDHPSKIFDFVYDLFRKQKYKRKEDVETFYIYIDKNFQLEKIDFNYNGTGTYSGEQKFFIKRPKHFSKIISGRDFKLEGKRPIIYINTWNHMFSEKPTSKLEYKRIDKYTLKFGSRKQVENTFRKKR
ncbi:hypothetical protein KAU33_01555 [Candidatus Dependentiae bacterium]|nr:hypothetical protein [Candidatus Dependentiae bacterium]